MTLTLIITVSLIGLEGSIEHLLHCCCVHCRVPYHHCFILFLSLPPHPPDELKHIIGAETTRKGILRVFEMFQHQQLNRRLVYVFLEGFLETMFPQYKFPELFVKLHSRSPRIRTYSQKVRTLQKR